MEKNCLLKEEMKEMRFSGLRLAAKIGMKPSTFQSRLSGRTAWTVPEAVKIAQELCISDAEIVKYFG